jgi:hypothetical protein
MRFSPFILGFFVFIAPAAFAEMYHWTDEEGVLHVTDDLKKVPKELRGKVKTIETEPAPGGPAVEPQRPAEERISEGQEELFGDHPLSWWMEKFGRMKEEIEELESEVDRKEMFIDVYERGWMMREFFLRLERGEDGEARRALERGAIFTPEEVATYERYRKEILEEDERLKGLEEDLDELRRKARILGVPRKIRE